MPLLTPRLIACSFTRSGPTPSVSPSPQVVVTPLVAFTHGLLLAPFPYLLPSCSFPFAFQKTRVFLSPSIQLATRLNHTARDHAAVRVDIKKPGPPSGETPPELLL